MSLKHLSKNDNGYLNYTRTKAHLNLRTCFPSMKKASTAPKQGFMLRGVKYFVSNLEQTNTITTLIFKNIFNVFKTANSETKITSHKNIKKHE